MFICNVTEETLAPVEYYATVRGWLKRTLEKKFKIFVLKSMKTTKKCI